MTLSRRWTLALLAGPLLTALGCAQMAAPPPQALLPTNSPGSDHSALSGRLALTVAAHAERQAQSLSAAFELRGGAQAGNLDLSTPLGTLLATARWSADEVWLTLPQGPQRFASLDELSRSLLGDTLPLQALFDWLRGRPWPEAEAPQDLTATGFRQIGWDVDLTRFDESWVRLHRPSAPEITLRARLDR